MSNIQIITQQIVEWIGHAGLKAVPIEILYILAMILAATVLLGMFVAPLAGFSTYVERRVAGRMQSRIGCNRVGPEGLLQFLADGIKLLSKEDNIPHGADQVLFRMAPYLVVIGAFMSFVCIPFGKHLVVADLNVGLVYLIAISSFAVVGILLAGWASNNKWSLLGAMRSAAQIVSYEVPLGLALLVPVFLCGSLSLQDLNAFQAGGTQNWIIFSAFPAPLIAFFIYYISALAEVNRTPFDLPEAESELVAGYSTEYSGIRWGLFFVAEYANMFLVSAIAVTCFLGGWQPSSGNIVFAAGALFFTLFLGAKSLIYLTKLVQGLVSGKRLSFLVGNIRPVKFSKPVFITLTLISVVGAVLMQQFAEFWLIGLLMFIAKTYFLVFVMIWLRWTLPRYRIDQLMDLCWKKLIPLSFGCIVWVSLVMLFTGVGNG